MIPKDGPVDVAAVYTELGVPPTADGYDVAYICSNSYGTDKYKKINPRAKFKPYRYSGKNIYGNPITDKPSDLTDEERRAINYGMTPATFGLVGGQVKALPWTQWQAPTPGTHWCRITDFAGYQDPEEISSVNGVMLYPSPSNPEDPMRPIGPAGKGDGKGSFICADLTLTSTNDNVLCIRDFTNTATHVSFDEMCFTLFAGISDGSDFFGSGIVYGIQTQPLKNFDKGNAWNIKLRLKITSKIAAQITDDHFLMYCVCLCPPLTFTPELVNGVTVTSPYNDDNSSTFIKSDYPLRVAGVTRPGVGGTEALGPNLSEKVISLDMWNDGFVSIYCCDSLGTWNTPAPSGTIYVTGHPNIETAPVLFDYYLDGKLHFTRGNNVVKIVLASEWQNSSAFGFSNGNVKMALRLSNSTAKYSTVSSAPIQSTTLGVTTDGTYGKVLEFSVDESMEDFSVPLSDFRTAIPKGSYTLEVSLVYMADGIYDNGTTRKWVYLDDDGSLDYVKDLWIDSQDPHFPTIGIYSKITNLGTVTIS